MTTSMTRGPLRRSAHLILAGALSLAAVHGAAADDNGLDHFFSSIFGGGAPQQAAPAPAAVQSFDDDVPSASRGRSRPLTVRLHPAKPRLVFVEKPSKPEPVSIFEDRTLKRGDAVMTASGVRVFAGSSSWPYAAKDFVALGDAKQLSRDTSKVLAQLDKLPRG